MTADLSRVARAAWQLWKRDRAILGPLTGLFLFVPQWAVLLLVPSVPRLPEGGAGEAAMTAWTEAVATWVAANGLLYLGATLLSLFGQLAVAALYLGPAAGVPGPALRRALALIARFVLATVVVSAPLGLAALALMSTGGAGVLLALVPIFYVLGRTMLLAPVLANEPRTGAVAAAVRSWTLTRRRGLATALLVAGATIPGQIVGAVLSGTAQSLSGKGLGNPVVIAAIDAGAAAAAWASGLALVLAAVTVYRAVAR